jgi:peptide/nickel transport system permease protein
MMIVSTAFSLNLVGDALRDRLDPRFRQVFGEKG